MFANPCRMGRRNSSSDTPWSRKSRRLHLDRSSREMAILDRAGQEVAIFESRRLHIDRQSRERFFLIRAFSSAWKNLSLVALVVPQMCRDAEVWDLDRGSETSLFSPLTETFGGIWKCGTNLEGVHTAPYRRCFRQEHLEFSFLRTNCGSSKNFERVDFVLLDQVLF